jgi:hypothetical protein
MVRKATVQKIETMPVNGAAVQQGTVALAETSRNLAKVAELMGYDLPYSQERIVQEARFYMGQSAEAMLEAGKRLVLLKENESHGEFIQIVEERLGIPARTAQQMMQAAVKYLANPALTAKAQTFALLGKSKLFELMTLDDDSLNELAEGGTIADLKLDDIDRMSVRELKAALREIKETAEATDKVMAAKNKKIDQLTTALERKKSTTPAGEWEWAPVRREVLEAAESITNFAQTELRRAFVGIDEHAEAGGTAVPEDILLIREQALTAAMQSLVSLQKEFHINADLESMVTPPWMKDFKSGSNEQNS